ncbi:O-antigen ligase-related protein [Candidatus Omnitrophus magneticus]|uniref:O-antigen ligase-related protein n=1 Tax=Candidatus Omnitrophus magneticus TaxID=1609969 RepID=A0A0F0CVF4_9BACT|nr:O-antigen ligase-related protein [Candidatus Omnitrophus magneticus]
MGIMSRRIASTVKKILKHMKTIAEFIKNFFTVYKEELRLFLFVIIILKVGRRWQDSVWGIVFFLFVFFVLIQMPLKYKLYMLIFLIPWAESRQLPGKMLGVTGFNIINSLFLMIGATLFYEKRKLFSPSIFNNWILLYIILIAVSAYRGTEAIPAFGGYYNLFTYILNALIKPIEIILAGIMVFYVLKSPNQHLQFLRIIKFAGAILVLYILVRGGRSIDGIWRLARTISIHKNALSFICLTLLSMNLATMNFGTNTEKIVNRFLNILYILGIMFTFSRQGYLSCLAILAIFSFRKGPVLTLLFFIGISLFWIYFMPIEVKKRIYTGTAEGEKLGVHEHLTGDVTAGRKEAWAACMPVIEEHLLFGQGLYAYVKSIGADRPELPHHPHNAYLQTLLDNGVAGSILFVSFFVMLIKKSWRLYKKSRSKFASAYGYGFAVTIVIFLFQGYTGFRFYPYEESYFVWFYLGGLMWVEKNQAYLIKQGM